MEKEIKTAINQIRNDNWQHKLSCIKPSNQSVWTTARILKNEHKIIPPLESSEKLCITAQEKANSLADQFAANHCNPLANSEPEFTTEVNEKVENFFNDPSIDFACNDYANEEELVCIVKNLKNKKAPGIDKINNTLIKKLPSRGIFYLLFIINCCLKLSYFPERWKHAKVKPILKHGETPTKAENYRPISLLSSISKLLERVILNRINEFLDENEIIPEEQHGFKRKFSTTHQLSKIIKHAKEKLKEKYSTGFVKLDVEKAFDRVWHNGLLAKMISLNFPPFIIKMIKEFLSNRSFHVDVNGARSSSFNIPFGVPQGAVLSPILYNIYTYDIPKFLDTTLALFADDTAFFCSSPLAKTITDALKKHAELIANYMQRWKINLNNKKTQAIFITNRLKLELPGRHIKIFGKNVQWQSENKYLGFILEKRMTFKKHIEYVIDRANVAVSTLYPLIARNSKLHVRNKLLIYKLAIRPILTYACPAFINIAACHLKTLQKFQNKSLRMILNRRRNERIDSLHEESGVPLVKDYIEKLSTKFNNSQN
jgi:hypothetical protein